MTNDTQIADVPHLGGSAIGYRFGRPYDPSLPTLVMVNSFVTSSALYRPQFDDAALGRAANLLAMELYGHGATRTASEQFTYWDSAIANIQVLDALKIPFAFVLGTSQGGWVAARMAMLAPQKIKASSRLEPRWISKASKVKISDAGMDMSSSLLRSMHFQAESVMTGRPWTNFAMPS